MKTLTITETFDAYPAGTNLRTFTKGEEVSVSDAFGAILIDKGLGREIASAPAKDSTKPVAAEAAPEEDDAK